MKHWPDICGIIYNYPPKGRLIVVDIIIPRREASMYISTTLH